jgi:hypothetical protein
MSKLNKEIVNSYRKRKRSSINTNVKTKYAFRAECRRDVDLFVELAKVDQKDIEITPDNSGFGFPDCDVILYSNNTLKQIRAIMDNIVDGHVMFETLNSKRNYTGDRWHTQFRSVI